jgi:hypothetical protein
MVHKKGKRALLTAVSILVVLLAIVGTIVIIKALNPGTNDPYAQQTTNKSTDDTPTDQPDSPSTTPLPDDADGTSSTEPAIDPATVATIDVTPMSLTVSYTKGVGGFEYEVLRRPNGTRYVEFSSPELVGTKCTNDKGVFASILESPASEEAVTLAKTTKVGGMTYGLSLAAVTCTSNEALLKNYQKAFSTAFSLIKKTN